MTDTPTGHKPLTLAAIAHHQFAKGKRKYGTTLAEAALPVSALALHALEELVDLAAYLDAMPGGAVGFLPTYDALALPLLAIADHPKPLPPDVPTAAAIAEHGAYWQLNGRVVEVVTRGGSLYYREVGMGGALPIGVGGDWLGPVPMRAVRS
jgi:hypothetical protein